MPTDNLDPYGSAYTWVSWDVSLNGATNVGLVPGTEEPVIGFGVVGVLWTAVRGVLQVTPLSVQAFRPYSNRYEPSFYGGVDPSHLNARHAYVGSRTPAHHPERFTLAMEPIGQCDDRHDTRPPAFIEGSALIESKRVASPVSVAAVDAPKRVR